MTYRILVTGWRDWPESQADIIGAALEGVAFPIWEVYGDRITVVHGQCPYGGADHWADEWARTYLDEGTHIAEPEAHPAERFGSWPSCGPKRNQHMVNLGADICLAFPGPGSRGTWDCLRKASEAGIRCVVYSLTEQTSHARMTVPLPARWRTRR